MYSTIDSRLQEVAARALRAGLLAYDKRHGYRGPESQAQPGEGAADRERRLAEAVAAADLLPAIVTSVGERSGTVYTREAGDVALDWAGLSWARRHVDADRRGPAPRKASDVLAVGDLVRVQRVGDGWRLAQLPAIEGAIVALSPLTVKLRDVYCFTRPDIFDIELRGTYSLRHIYFFLRAGRKKNYHSDEK